MSNEVLAAQVMQALARGDKIGAVKLVREAGVGSLREAMKYVEVQAVSREPAMRQGVQADSGARARARAPLLSGPEARRPTVEMGDAPGQLRWLLVVVFLLGLAGWLLLGWV